jgi:hypothetical protein
MRFVTHTRWEMDDVSCLVLILAIMCVCVSAAPPLRAGALMHAQTFLKFWDYFYLPWKNWLASSASAFHLFITWYIWRSTWRKPGLHLFRSPFDFYATILLMIMSKFCEPFLIGGGLYEKTIYGKTSPACLSNKTDNCNCGVLIWFLFFIE